MILIRREDVIKIIRESILDLEYDGENNELVSLIESLPTIEPKRGEWVEDARFEHLHYCSVCGHKTAVSRCPNFCPNCGARMKGADNE